MLKGIRILVAEDNVLNQRIVNFILQKQDAEITTVANGSLAIEALQERNFDVVLMDLQMPEMDGFEATEFIRQKMNLTIPIIALSASKLSVDVEKCHAAGMNECISKPFDPLELCELILKAIKEQNNITGKRTI